jgi:hypothetical protein
MNPFSCVVVLCGLTRVAFSSATPAPQRPALPPAFESYLATAVRPTARERQTLMSGAPIAKLLDSDASKEVAVFGAVWVSGSPAQYVRRVKDIENFERGGAFRITKRISDPPKLEDFAQLELPAEDLKDLRSCKIGDCEVKLGAKALQQLRTEVHWGTRNEKTEAEAVFRQRALEYVTEYRQGGNAKLAVYRDADDPVFVADEFRSMIERVPALVPMPDLLQFLLDYPSATLEGSSELFYWQDVQFGLKPTIRINHLVIQDRPGATVIATKMLYASHYFWTALELRVLVPDPSRGTGFWFVTINRSRSDGLSGFIGRLVRGRVRNEAVKGTLAVLKTTKAGLESQTR